MDKEAIKKSIIILTIGIVIIIILLIIAFLNSKKEQEEEKTIDKGNMQETQETITDKEKIEQYDFLVVSNCVSAYLSGINQNNSSYYGRDENENYTKIVEQEQINKNAYNLLSSEYIEKNAVTLKNVYEHVPKVDQNLMFVPIDMKLKEGENVNKYLVYGYAIDLEYNFIGYLYVIVNLDMDSKAFSIEPIDESIYQTALIENNNIRVPLNENNGYLYQQLSEEYRLKQYFQNYKMMLLSNVDIAYEFLDNDYKEKCFGNVDNFKKYINQNRDKLKAATLEGYEVKINGDYTEYVEKDVKGEYYIFNISNKNAAEFKVMLNTYIIGSSDMKEEYEKASNSKKVSLNAMRFIYAINDKNYYYAYNILAESFKNRNFNTQEHFEKYVKDYFFEKNIMKEGSLKEEGQYYTYHLTIEDELGNTKKLTIIMQLQEGTDFVMSFNIE